MESRYKESVALLWADATTHRSVKNTMNTILRILFDSIPRECSTNACSRSSDLWITAAGLCQNLTGFPKTECDCKSTTFFLYLQIILKKNKIICTYAFFVVLLHQELRPIRFMQTKTCPRCGSSFLCQPEHPEQCQCAGVVLSDSARRYMVEHYPNRCLCAQCLRELSK